MPTNIDGTDISSATIDGTEVQEITVDGDVVYTAVDPTIGATVEDWERSGALNDWSDQTGRFNVVSTAPEGTNSLEYDSTNSAIITRTSGLDATPSKGDTFSSLLKETDTGDEVRPGFGYGWSGGENNPTGYFATWQFSPGASIFRYDGTGWEPNDETTILDVSASLTNGEWYEFEVVWHDGTGSEPEDTHELTVYEVDSSLERINTIGSGTVQDSTYANQTGISVGTWRNATTTDTMHDRYVIYE